MVPLWYYNGGAACQRRAQIIRPCAPSLILAETPRTAQNGGLARIAVQPIGGAP